MSKIVDIDKALVEIIVFQIGVLILLNLLKIMEHKIMKKTMDNCAISIPRLNENKGNTIVSSLPKRDLSK